MAVALALILGAIVGCIVSFLALCSMDGSLIGEVIKKLGIEIKK